MIKQGFIEEVRGLLEKGYGFDLPSMSSLGYKQIGLHLQGTVDLSTAIQQIKFETHRFARHQYAWFHLNDGRICWLNIKQRVEEVILPMVSEIRT